MTLKTSIHNSSANYYANKHKYWITAISNPQLKSQNSPIIAPKIPQITIWYHLKANGKEYSQSEAISYTIVVKFSGGNMGAIILLTSAFLRRLWYIWMEDTQSPIVLKIKGFFFFFLLCRKIEIKKLPRPKGPTALYLK